jgi:hypothetical protein
MKFECGIGWERVLDRYFGEISQALPVGTRLNLEQVYQKYGSLRIDATAEGDATPETRVAMDKAEILADSRSYRYCETCGKPGTLRDNRWLYVACEDHANGAAPCRQTRAALPLTALHTSMTRHPMILLW